MIDTAIRVRKVIVEETGLAGSAFRFSDDLTADHGIDDLDLMKIAMRLEDEFGVRVSDDALQRDRTPAKCIELVRAGRSACT